MELYIIVEDGTELCKVGVAISSKQRLLQLQTATSRRLTLYASLPCDEAARAETLTHRALSEFHVMNEWFNVNPDIALSALQNAIESVNQTPMSVATKPLKIELTARRQLEDGKTEESPVMVNGFDRLTPRAARAALEIAFGNSNEGEVVDRKAGIGYRVYAKSARKIDISE